MTLRAAVRDAGVRVDAVVASGSPDETLAADLKPVVADVEAALRATQQSP